MILRYETVMLKKKARDAAIGSLGAPKSCVIVLGRIERIQRLVVTSSKAAITPNVQSAIRLSQAVENVGVSLPGRMWRLPGCMAGTGRGR